MYGGLPSQRAIGLTRVASGASVTAQIHDARAADELLLRAARSRRANWVRGSTPASFESPANPPLRSVADIEHQQALERAADNSQARALLEKARQAQAAGNSGVAAIYYGMAARRAMGKLQADIRDEAEQRRRADSVPSAKPAAGGS